LGRNRRQDKKLVFDQHTKRKELHSMLFYASASLPDSNIHFEVPHLLDEMVQQLKPAMLQQTE